MSKHENLLILHIFGAFVLVSGHALSVGVFMAAERVTRTRQFLLLAGLGKKAEMLLITPGTVIVVAFGLWLVHETGHGYGEAWLISAYALIVLAAVLGGAFLGPAFGRAAARAGELHAGGAEESEEPRAIIGRVSPVVHLETVIILLFIYLMVAKPGA